MASSGSTTWNPNTLQIITGAARLLSAIQSGETLPPDEYQDALDALNGIVHAWQASGILIWTQETITVPLVAGKASYQIGIGAPDVSQPRPVRATDARMKLISTGAETPLIPMTRLDYANLSGKTSPTGTVAQWFYDAQIPLGVLNVYPAPADNLSQVMLVAQRPMQDFVSQSDTADVPQEWISALRFALAVELAPEYDCPQARFEMIKTLADEKLAIVKAWDSEEQGTTTYPFSQGIYQLIAGALRLCGGCGPQDMPTLGVVNNAFYSLNAMVQAWQASGIHVWAEIDATLFLQPGQIRYQLGAASADHATLSAAWVQTATTATAAGGAASIALASASGVAGGNQIGIWLDSGSVFWTTVSGVSGLTATLAAALPSQAVSGAQVASYAAPLDRPLRVPAGRRYQFAPAGGQAIEVPMIVMARIDYANVPNKTTPGTPTQFFFDPQLSLGVMNIWPAPSNAQVAMKFTAQRPLATFADLSAVADFPVEWNAALRYSLAVEMWPEHVERRKTAGGAYDFATLKLLADERLMTARAWDREPESVRFGVAAHPSARN